MLLLYMLPDNHLYLGSPVLVLENIQKDISSNLPCKTTPFHVEPICLFQHNTLDWIESKRILVPGLKAFTLDVSVFSLSLALWLLNYLLHAGEEHLQCCGEMVLK